MALLLKGKPVVDSMTLALNERVNALKVAGVNPALAILRVGECPDDLSYERTAMKRATALGLEVKRYVLNSEASQADIESMLQSINDCSEVHGCLMFRPLPQEIDETAVCNMLNPSKDIDGIGFMSLASVFTNGRVGFPPATAQACLDMLDYYQVPIEGKHVVVVGRSLVIGKPVAMMLLDRNATVTVCHSRTQNLQNITREADIVICATGRAKAYGAEYFSAGQTVLDVGINFDADGNLCGDVDFAEVEPVVAAITPVPGGIGTVTTSVTMAHVVKAAEQLVF